MSPLGRAEAAYLAASRATASATAAACKAWTDASRASAAFLNAAQAAPDWQAERRELAAWDAANPPPPKHAGN